MYELTGTVKDMSIDFRTGQAVLSLAVNEKQTATSLLDELNGKKILVTISEYREKRSLAANRYLWHLCGELADKLSDDGIPHTKDDIYRDAIKARGIYREQGELPIDFAKTSRTAWEKLGTGWITEQVDFEPDGDRVIVRYYYGTSAYNKKQMKRVIDWLVVECEQQGIETKTQDELANMLSLWKAVV